MSQLPQDGPKPAQELTALQKSLQRGQPFGDAAWQSRTAASLYLASTFRPRGRPKKESDQ